MTHTCGKKSFFFSFFTKKWPFKNFFQRKKRARLQFHFQFFFLISREMEKRSLTEEDKQEIYKQYTRYGKKWCLIGKITGHPESTVRSFINRYLKSNIMTPKRGRPRILDEPAPVFNNELLKRNENQDLQKPIDQMNKPREHKIFPSLYMLAPQLFMPIDFSFLNGVNIELPLLNNSN